jgi:glycine cleavage system H protein
MRPTDRQYMKSHEWCKVEKDTATIGITDYAVEHLQDLVFLDLPSKGKKVAAGTSFAEIESVKAVSDIYSPVDGEIVDVNKALPENLDALKTDAFAAWMIKVKLSKPAGGMLSAKEYEEHLKSEAAG